MLEAEVGYEVGRLVFIPLHDVPRWAALAVAGMGKGGGRVFGAERARAGRRAFVLDRQGRAGDGLAFKLVVGIRILVVLCGVCHDARGGAEGGVAAAGGEAEGWHRGIGRDVGRERYRISAGDDAKASLLQAGRLVEGQGLCYRWRFGARLEAGPRAIGAPCLRRSEIETACFVDGGSRAGVQAQSQMHS